MTDEIQESIVTEEKPKWHQQFRGLLTKFEIDVLLIIRCDTKQEGIKLLRGHKLNSCLTTRCKDETEARAQLAQHIQAWFDDESLSRQPGQLLYWKVYDE